MPTIIEKLKSIPELAALVEAAAATPYRPPGARRHGKLTSSPMPPEVAAWDMLSTDGLLFELQQAVRMVWEQQAQRRPLSNPPTFAGECGWLIATEDEWRPDPLMHEWVRDSVGKVHRDLSRWIGETPPARIECTKCRGEVQRDDYSATGDGEERMACTDCGTVWTRHDLAHAATMHTPASLPDIATLIERTPRTLQRWADAGLVRPVSTHEPSPNNPALYLPADVARIAGMVRAVC